MPTVMIHNDGSTGEYEGVRYNSISHELGTYALHLWNVRKGVRIEYYRALAYTGTVDDAREAIRRHYAVTDVFNPKQESEAV